MSALASTDKGHSMLRAHPSHLAFWSVRKFLLKLSYQRSKVLQTIGRRLKNDHGDGELRERLLKGQVSVNRQKDIKLFLCTLSSSPFWIPAQPA
jgi:hypothetical protein